MEAEPGLGAKAVAASPPEDKGLIPFLACFLVVLRLVLETPGMDFISLLLTGGGWRTSFGGLVRHTGSPAALMRIPVMPGRAEHESGRAGESAPRHPLHSSLPLTSSPPLPRVLLTHGFSTYSVLFPETDSFAHLQHHALLSAADSP